MINKFPLRYLSVFIFILSVGCKDQSLIQESKCIQSKDNTEISYSTEGAGEITLFFVHGWCCNKKFWKFQTDHFLNKYRVVSIDLAGFGNSESREIHSFDDWGNDIISVIEDLKPRKYFIIGHSSGGYAVLNAATKADSGLLAIVGVDSFRGKLGNTFTEDYAKNAEEKLRISDQEFKESMRDIDSWFVAQSDSTVIFWIKNEMAKCDKETAAQAIREYYLNRNKLSETFKNVKCEIIGINKSKSKFDLEFFETNQIDFTAHYINNVGHFVMMDNPKIFNSLLENIIQSQIEISKLLSLQNY